MPSSGYGTLRTFVLLGLAPLLLASSCPKRDRTSPRRWQATRQLSTPARRPASPPTADDLLRIQRDEMVATQIAARGVQDERVLAAMRKVPRHEFVPASARALAYTDRPLPLGHDQTISQPFIVAYMSEALGVRPGARVLEIGTGSGYQAAVLAELTDDVYSIEIVKPLARAARQLLKRLGYGKVQLRTGDGYHGWHEAAPFDRIILTAAPHKIPSSLLDQLKIGGQLIAPEGSDRQVLVRITRTARGFARERLLGVRFVPMTGLAQD